MFSFFSALWASSEQLATLLRWLTYFGIASTAIFGVAVYYVNDRIGELQTAQIRSQGVEIKSQAQTVTDQSLTIANQNGKIIDLSKDINAVTTRSSDLELRLQTSERGIASFYDFNGAYRQSTGGRKTLIVGPETTVFKEIIKVYDDKNWILLRKICSEEIVKVPLWISPYLFAGIASANLGDLEDAENKLRYVVEKSGGDPNYADASRILIEIESQKKDLFH